MEEKTCSYRERHFETRDEAESIAIIRSFGETMILMVRSTMIFWWCPYARSNIKNLLGLKPFERETSKKLMKNFTAFLRLWGKRFSEIERKLLSRSVKTASYVSSRDFWRYKSFWRILEFNKLLSGIEWKFFGLCAKMFSRVVKTEFYVFR